MVSKRVVGTITGVIAIALVSLLASPNFGYRAGKFRDPPPKHQFGKPVEGSPHSITDRTLLLLKTGIEVAYTRLPAHFETTFNIYPHHAVYADSDDTINGMPMIDALAFLDTETLNAPELQAYRVRRQSRADNWHWNAEKLHVPNDDRGGWNLDRFKNIPAFADAYLKNPSFDWYVMIDADSYFPASTLAEVTRGSNPDQPLYFGKGVGSDPLFAHGGSGIVLSRGALRSMFGNSLDTAKQTVTESGKYVASECCGDQATAYMFQQKTGLSSLDFLQRNEFGQFQGNPFERTEVLFSEYCNPIGTFHAVPPAQINELYHWEKSKGARTIYYADFYHDYILPEIALEKPDWYLELTAAQLDTTVFDAPHEAASSKDSCRAMCEQDELCTMWHFLGGSRCAYTRQAISRGKAMNKFSPKWNSDWTESTAGFMIDRIAAFRQNQRCERHSNQTEGYAYHYDIPGSIVLHSRALPSAFEGDAPLPPSPPSRRNFKPRMNRRF